jgi:hypothetical protein
LPTKLSTTAAPSGVGRSTDPLVGAAQAPVTNAALPASTPIRAADLSPMAVATGALSTMLQIGSYQPARLVVGAK